MTFSALVPLLFGAIGLAAARYVYLEVKKYPAGEDKVARIADQIHIGAMVFMRREYTLLALFSLGAIREILGDGALFGVRLFGENFEPWVIMILPPGGFLTLKKA